MSGWVAAALLLWITFCLVRWVYGRWFLPNIPELPGDPDPALKAVSDAQRAESARTGRRRYLVTGGAGCLGRHVAERLLERDGDAVRVLDCRQTWHDDRVEFVCGDLRDPDVVARACLGVDYVVHSASSICLRMGFRTIYSINVLGTANVVAACIRTGCQYLVYTSTFGVVMDGTDKINVAEKDLPDPCAIRNGTLYGHSKAAAEALVLRANGIAGLHTVALRPMLLWGPRDHNYTLPFLAVGAILGSGCAVQEVVYVENLAEAHLEALARLQSHPHIVGGHAYFISDGRSTYLEMGQRLLKAVGDRRRLVHVPGWCLTPLTTVMEVVNWLTPVRLPVQMCRVNAGSVIITQRTYTADTSKAAADLCYVPRFSIDDALERMGAYWRREHTNHRRERVSHTT